MREVRHPLRFPLLKSLQHKKPQPEYMYPDLSRNVGFTTPLLISSATGAVKGSARMPMPQPGLAM